jgi:hypothetical protein
MTRARGSVVERQTDNLKVPGSIPGAPTKNPLTNFSFDLLPSVP